MSRVARRIVYGTLAAFGFALTVPFSLRARVWRAEVAGGAGLDAIAGAGELAGPALLAGFGLLLAVVFLYAALTTGEPRSWRPIEDGEIRCGRCAAALRFGVRRCSECGQQLVW